MEGESKHDPWLVADHLQYQRIVAPRIRRETSAFGSDFMDACSEELKIASSVDLFRLHFPNPKLRPNQLKELQQSEEKTERSLATVRRQMMNWVEFMQANGQLYAGGDFSVREHLELDDPDDGFNSPSHHLR